MRIGKSGEIGGARSEACGFVEPGQPVSVAFFERSGGIAPGWKGLVGVVESAAGAQP